MEAGRTPDDAGGRRADHHRQLGAAQLHRQVPRARSPCRRRWPSRSTPWPRGWPTRSAPTTSPRTARRLGITSPIQLDPSMALGAVEVSPLEMAQAYAPFANGGFAAKAYGIERIRTASGRVLYDHGVDARRAPRGDRPAGAALHEPDDAPGGRLAAPARAPRVAGLRPGRQDRHHQRLPDAWFVGYTGGFVTAVWVGKDDNTPMKQGHRRRRAGRHLARLHGRGPAAPEGPADPRRRRRPRPPPAAGDADRRRSSTASATCCTATASRRAAPRRRSPTARADDAPPAPAEAPPQLLAALAARRRAAARPRRAARRGAARASPTRALHHGPRSAGRG